MDKRPPMFPGSPGGIRESDRPKRPQASPGYDMKVAAEMLAALKPLDADQQLSTLAVVCKVIIEGRLSEATGGNGS